MIGKCTVYITVILLVTGLTITSVGHTAFADKDIGQTAEKFFKKCEKAGDSEKKQDQSEDQAEHHGDKFGPTIAFCN